LPPTHLVMNLPAIAISFLDVFAEIFAAYPSTLLPRVHVYCFSTAEDRVADVIARAEQSIGHGLVKARDSVLVHDVRNVAPNKHMMCISFNVPTGVTLLHNENHAKGGPAKKQRIV